MFPLQLSSFFKYWPLKKKTKNLPEFCLESKQRNDIFYLLSIMGHHAHLVPSQVSAGKRSAPMAFPPTQQEQDATTTSNLHLSKAML